tara:strand:- start:33 stop:713 length:681 start_codon:yes stop_codon:yes gene_type:complete
MVNECKEWFLKKHYAKRLPNTSYAFGIYKNKNNLLIGVCSYGKPMSSTLINGSFNGFYKDNFMELNRLVITDNTEKNVLSYFVSQTLKKLQAPSVVVSYADTSQNHHGYIYQATNWIYTGLSSRFKDYAVKGLEHLHHSSIEDSVGRYDKNTKINKHELLKQKYGDRLYRQERSRKHRYFYILGNKKQRKEMIKNLTYKVKPYPKGNNKKYDASYKPSTQGVLFLK